MPRESRGPVLCLVTDRHRLLTQVGRTPSAWSAVLLAQVAGAIRGGIDVVQIREPDLEARDLAALARTCLATAHGTPARIVVNDRLDVAIAVGADGTHLRENGIPPAVARRLTSGRLLLGRSVHSADSAARSGAADYVIAGSVFETASKPGIPARLDLDGFEAIARSSPCPVWAVGGVTLERIPALLARGARGIAGIGLFMPPGETADLAAAVQNLTANLRLAFDTRRPPF